MEYWLPDSITIIYFALKKDVVGLHVHLHFIGRHGNGKDFFSKQDESIES